MPIQVDLLLKGMIQHIQNNVNEFPNSFSLFLNDIKGFQVINPNDTSLICALPQAQNPLPIRLFQSPDCPFWGDIPLSVLSCFFWALLGVCVHPVTPHCSSASSEENGFRKDYGMWKIDPVPMWYTFKMAALWKKDNGIIKKQLWMNFLNFMDIFHI